MVWNHNYEILQEIIVFFITCFKTVARQSHAVPYGVLHEPCSYLPRGLVNNFFDGTSNSSVLKISFGSMSDTLQ
jgi:hypothetical protein